MDRCHEFIATVRDLSQCVSGNQCQDYDIIRASALVRKLIADGGTSLLDQVNRKFREKILFDVVEYSDLPVKVTAHLQLAPGFETPKAPGRVRKSRDAFLNMQAGFLGETRVSVRDILKYNAYVLGGVHSGKPSEAGQFSLAEMDKIMSFFGRPASVVFFRNLALIVVHALQPLIARIENLKRSCVAITGFEVTFAKTMLGDANPRRKIAED